MQCRARDIADAISQSGYARCIVKRDQEPALLEAKREGMFLARQEAGIEAILE